jgi:L-lactate dehydrogenase complex protein LldF
VKIPLPMLFIRMRDEAIEMGITSIWERLIFAAWTLGLRWPMVYTMGQTLSGWFMRKIMANKAGWVNWMPGPPGGWTRKRPLPAMAKKTFRSQWKQRPTQGQ